MSNFELSDLDIPPEARRTEEQRADIYRTQGLIRHLHHDHYLDSTEGHLALLRAIQLGRKLERQKASKAVEAIRAARAYAAAHDDPGQIGALLDVIEQSLSPAPSEARS